jgi:hypothetical protein
VSAKIPTLIYIQDLKCVAKRETQWNEVVEMETIVMEQIQTRGHHKE